MFHFQGHWTPKEQSDFVVEIAIQILWKQLLLITVVDKITRT
jgi:hypothetical protein